ncbi:MAG: hypothetical protein E6I44_08275 [Chloroflexi bacterium]|nr:MAG: hypothetical protein E6I44_08275 [Chloroflexota bacterium]
MATRKIDISYSESGHGWVARVTTTAPRKTSHVVRVSRAELERYGGGDVHELLRRSFEFLLDREANTSILPEFDLGTIERYFPEYRAAMKRS